MNDLARARRHLSQQQQVRATMQKNINQSDEIRLLIADQVLAAEAWVRDAEWRATEGKPINQNHHRVKL